MTDALTARLRELPRYRGVCSQDGCTTGQFEGWWVSARALDELLAASPDPDAQLTDAVDAYLTALNETSGDRSGLLAQARLRLVTIACNWRTAALARAQTDGTR